MFLLRANITRYQISEISHIPFTFKTRNLIGCITRYFYFFVTKGNLTLVFHKGVNSIRAGKSSLRKQPSFFAHGPIGVSLEGRRPSSETPIGP